MPVLSAKGQGYSRKAIGTVLGYVSVYSLGSNWVSHGHKLIKQRLRDYILGNKRREIITLERRLLKQSRGQARAKGTSVTVASCAEAGTQLTEKSLESSVYGWA